MDNKLQQLTEKLYQEGFSKGEEEGKRIIHQAQEEAKKIMEDAHQKASQILHQAQLQSEELKKNTESEIRMASRQSIETVKQTIEHFIVAKSIGESTAKVLDDITFVKELIKSAIKAYNPQADAQQALTVVLPAEKESLFLSLVQGKMEEEFGKNTAIRFDKNIRSGFRIGKTSDGFLITFTAEDFEHLFAHFMRPATEKLIFG